MPVPPRRGNRRGTQNSSLTASPPPSTKEPAVFPRAPPVYLSQSNWRSDRRGVGARCKYNAQQPNRVQRRFGGSWVECSSCPAVVEPSSISRTAFISACPWAAERRYDRSGPWTVFRSLQHGECDRAAGPAPGSGNNHLWPIHLSGPYLVIWDTRRFALRFS